jgi:hypothetical protein
MKKEICQNILAYDIPKKFQTHTRCQDKHGFIPSTFGCNYEYCMFSFSLGEINPLRVMFENFETELDKRMHCFIKIAKMSALSSDVNYC